MIFERAQVAMTPVEHTPDETAISVRNFQGAHNLVWDGTPIIIDKYGAFPVLVKGEWLLYNSKEKFN